MKRCGIIHQLGHKSFFLLTFKVVRRKETSSPSIPHAGPLWQNNAPQRTRVFVLSVLWKESSQGLISIKGGFIFLTILTVLGELKSFYDQKHKSYISSPNINF